MKSFHTPVFLSFLSFLSSLPYSISPKALPFYQLITINHDLYLCLVQTLCLHLNPSAPLRKIPAVDYYLGIHYFQHPPHDGTRVRLYDSLQEEEKCL